MVLAALVSGPLLVAQNAPRLRDVNANTWLVYSADQTLRGPWGVHAEVNVRRANAGAGWQQFQLHGAATYRVSPRIQAAVAFIWMRNYPYGDFPGGQHSIERRVHQQLTIRQPPWKRLELEHRMRLDQRWLQQYENRTRYQFRAVLPLTKPDSDGRQNYLLAADEVLFHLPPKRGALYFNQNRAIAGFGRRFSPTDRIEFHYMHQFLYQRNGMVVESNHTLRVQFSTTAPLFWRKPEDNRP